MTIFCISVYIDGLQCFQEATNDVKSCMDRMSSGMIDLAAKQLESGMNQTSFFREYCQYVHHMYWLFYIFGTDYFVWSTFGAWFCEFFIITIKFTYLKGSYGRYIYIWLDFCPCYMKLDYNSTLILFKNSMYSCNCLVSKILSETHFVLRAKTLHITNVLLSTLLRSYRTSKIAFNT